MRWIWRINVIKCFLTDNGATRQKITIKVLTFKNSGVAWFLCFNVDWMRLELAKLGWSLAEVVFDVYRDVYRSLLCAVKCRCPGVALDEYFAITDTHSKILFLCLYVRGQLFFHPRNDNHDMFLCVQKFS